MEKLEVKIDDVIIPQLGCLVFNKATHLFDEQWEFAQSFIRQLQKYRFQLGQK